MINALSYTVAWLDFSIYYQPKCLPFILKFPQQLTTPSLNRQYSRRTTVTQNQNGKPVLDFNAAKNGGCGGINCN